MSGRAFPRIVRCYTSSGNSSHGGLHLDLILLQLVPEERRFNGSILTKRPLVKKSPPGHGPPEKASELSDSPSILPEVGRGAMVIPVASDHYPGELPAPPVGPTPATTRRVALRCLSFTPTRLPPVKPKLGLLQGVTSGATRGSEALGDRFLHLDNLSVRMERD